ncbi:MAG: hypothetical protein IIU17_07390 [Muribaculaceae bacterium]|nr:hypothetical protein [Muribaculaceae bacterium]
MSIINEILSLIPGYDTRKSVDENVADFSDKVKRGLTGGAIGTSQEVSQAPVSTGETVAEISLEQAFVNSLKQLQCDYEKIVQDEDEQDSCYQFNYQSKTFRARYVVASDVVNLCYPCFYAANIDDLNVVRYFCNHFNDSLLIPKITYGVDGSKGDVYVHAEVVINKCSPQSLHQWLDVFFQIQHSFTLRIEKEMEENRGGFFRDFEYQRALTDRENTLAKELELAHQSETLNVPRTSSEFTFTIADFIDIAYTRCPVREYKKLRIVTGDSVTTCCKHDEIASMPLSHPLIQKGETAGKDCFVEQEAIMIVEFCDLSNECHSITINLHAKGENDDTLYYKAYAMLEPLDLAREQSIAAAQATQATSGFTSILLAYDRRDIKQKQQEFDYMWKDALIKDRDNDPSITSDEMLLCQITSPAVGLSFYWGKRCFAAGLFAQALKHFLNAYNKEKTLTAKVTDAMEQLCYYIGFCYSEMGMYDRAYYYLELNRNSGEISHCSELINVLANSGDLRAFHYLRAYMKTIDENFTDADEIPENVKKFMSFLKRRHAYCLINAGMLDQAEKEFKELLDDPLSSDYAQGELQYIQLLREKQASAPQGNDEAASTPSN